MNVAIKYKPHEYIKPFHADREKYFIRAIVTGFGGGKTYAGCMELLQCSGLNKGVPNIYIEPTYQMIRDILEPEMITILDNNAVPYQHNKSEHNFYFPLWDGNVWLRSGDKPEKLKGINAGMIGIDEPFIQDEGIFKIALSRARHPKAKVKGIFLTGTPEQLNWGYDLLVDEIKDNTIMYRGTTLDNIDYLGSNYVEHLRTHYSEKEARAYIQGEFVNLTTGNCYYPFSEENIIKSYTYNEYKPIEVSCDFNVDLMCWNISQEWDGFDYIFDYVELEGQANTDLMCQMLKSKQYEVSQDKFKSHSGNYIFYVDIAGSQRHPEASRTNIAIIQDHFPYAEIYFQNVRNIKDRIDSTNARLKNSKGDIKLKVHQRCKRLIKDLRQVTWELLLNKGRAGNLTHSSDGLSYLCHWKYPLTGKILSRQGG